MFNKIKSLENAVQLVKDNDTICLSGSGGGLLEPDFVLEGLEQRFLETGHPRDLTIMHVAGIGDSKQRGLNRLTHPGMVKRVIGGHWGWSPRLGEMALNSEIEAYNLPQGTISLLFREIAAGRPGLITKIGLGTFADPRIEGGKLNRVTNEDLVELIELNGKEYLFYKSCPIHVAIVVGSMADENGNISLEHEPAYLDVQAMAMAAHNSGRKVIVQVKEQISSDELDSRRVKIPGSLVDAVVVHPEQWQTYEGEYNPAFSGEKKVPIASLSPLPLDCRKVIARRAAMELRPGLVANLGYGMPDGVAAVAAEEGISDWLTFSVEQGPVGGVPAKGAIFGVSTNPDAILDQPSNFDFYHGGGLDLTVLSFAEVDQYGNVNVSKFGGRLAGCGGFVDISQSAKKVIFVGTFTAGGLDVQVKDADLRIRKEGKHRKFVENVEQITFSGNFASKSGQDVQYITERAVFRLVDGALELIEIAPGVDLKRDVLGRMDFKPKISAKLKTMMPSLFKHERMELKRMIHS